jgi:hypothetical protein
LTVTTNGGGGTQQSATTRDTQAPTKHKVCWFVEEVRREEGGVQVEDAPLVISLSCNAIEERSSVNDTKEAVKKSLLWFPLPWGWGPFQPLSAMERAQELFQRKMRKLSLYNDEENPLAGSINRSLATMHVFMQNNTILMLSSDKGL